MGVGGSTSVSLNRGSHTNVRKGSSTTAAAAAAAAGRGGGHLVPPSAGPQVPIMIVGEDVAQPGTDQDMPQAMGGGVLQGQRDLRQLPPHLGQDPCLLRGGENKRIKEMEA
uniref:Uncharacterized protein n=1 Tax=Chromera velia CCMP2878 TaxID=1169474 RepID=A0A0G4FE76_9ALVE|eukprot:Cvel_16557.t1-p1 / transcript=Cvel_16557.t1 / gene=Cvel_16557 / organism=Chromera_velia_CCMP2878 / gene_product=hypothetical protein / transcript_product=hypothetical protein / location=Cvel_scaffold1280:43409-43738(+) / protein_length=110 / sequence_SO=supercontig / SO=protein_coding / is_pseudo=false